MKKKKKRVPKTKKTYGATELFHRSLVTLVVARFEINCDKCIYLTVCKPNSSVCLDSEQCI